VVSIRDDVNREQSPREYLMGDDVVIVRLDKKYIIILKFNVVIE